MALTFVQTQVSQAGGSVSVNGSGGLALTPLAGQGIALNGGILTSPVDTTWTLANGSGSGVNGHKLTIVTGTGGGGVSQGGDLPITLGAGSGGGRFGQLALTGGYAYAQAPSGWQSGGGSGAEGWAAYHSSITGTQTVASGTTESASLYSRLAFTTLSGDFVGYIAATVNETLTDTSAFNYTGKIRACLDKITVQTATGSTISELECSPHLTYITAGADGTMTNGYSVSAELLHSSDTYTITQFQSGYFSTQIKAAGNVTTGYGINSQVFTDVGSTGTFTTLGAGVWGIVNHNSNATIAHGIGVYGEVLNNGAGVVTAAAAFEARHFLHAGSSFGTSSDYLAVTPIIQSTATITTHIGVDIQNQAVAGITTSYGLRVRAQTQGVTTNAPFNSSFEGGKMVIQPTMTVASADQAAWDGVAFPGTTLTLTGTTAVTTSRGLNLLTVLQPTITDASGVTVNQASSVYIGNEPAAGGSVTLTNAYALWVAAGHVRFNPSATVASAAGSVWDGLSVPATTLTLTGTTQVTTTRGVNLVNIAQPTVTDASAATVNVISTLAIGNAPTSTGSITNGSVYGLLVGLGGATSSIVQQAASTYALARFAAHTISLANATQITAAVGAATVEIGATTVNQSGGAVTMDTAASLNIVGPPVAGASVTITNKWALLVQAGVVNLAGGGNILGGTVNLNASSNNPTNINTGNSTGAITLGNAAAGIITVANKANTAATMLVTDGTNNQYALDTRTGVSGVNVHTFGATGASFAGAAGNTYSLVSLAAFTLTQTGSTLVTALGGLALKIGSPTVTDASAETVTTASAVQIGGPLPTGSVTFTSSFALDIPTFATNGTTAAALRLAPPTGAGANYALAISSGNVLWQAATILQLAAATAVAMQVTDGTATMQAYDTRIATDNVTTNLLGAGSISYVSAGGSTYTNTKIKATTVNWTGGVTVTAAEGLQHYVDASTITAGQATTITQASGAIFAGLKPGTNATLTTGIHVHLLDAPTKVGTYTNQVGIKVDSLTQGATLNTAIWVQNPIQVGGAALATNNQIHTASQGAGTTQLFIGNASINVTSDARLKTDVVNTERDPLAIFNQLRVVDYTWNDPADQAVVNRNSRGRWTGMIAQEMVDVVPWIIAKPGDPEKDLYFVEYEHLVPLMVKGFQDVDSRLKRLEARLY